jgi:hypothetical protein
VRRFRAEGRSEKEAIELVETVDANRAAYIKKYFDIELPDDSKGARRGAKGDSLAQLQFIDQLFGRAI